MRIFSAVVGMFIIGLGCSGLAPGPSFRVINHGLSDCSTLLDVCARMTCAISNEGKAPGTARVQFALYDPNGTVHRATELADIPAGQVSSISHDFKEARLAGLAETRVECTLSP